MPNKYRKGGVKVEHTVLSEISSLLQMVASCPYVHSVTPGRISRSPLGPSKPQLVFQYFQHTGLKLIGKTSTAVQEVFVVSSQSQQAYEWLVARKLITPPADSKPKAKSKDARKPKNGKKKTATAVQYELTEASEMTLQRYLEKLRVEASEKLSPLTEEQKEQLRRLRSELEEAERRKKELQEEPSTSQAEKKRPTPIPKDNINHANTAQRQHRKSNVKPSKKQNTKPVKTMADWLEQTAGLNQEQWKELLRYFGKEE